MARQYKRDARGRFASAVGNAIAKRRNSKISKLKNKNNRVVRQYGRDKSLHGTPLGDSIERGVIKRQLKIDHLSGTHRTTRSQRVVILANVRSAQRSNRAGLSSLRSRR